MALDPLRGGAVLDTRTGRLGTGCFRSPKPQLHLAAPSVFSGLVALQVAPPG